MWAPWMAHWFHIQKNDIVTHNLRLSEIVAMWDSLKQQ